MSKELNDIADLIIGVSYAYDNYEDTARTINVHASLCGAAKKGQDYVKIEELDFESFDPEYLKALPGKWNEKQDALKKEHGKILYEVDTDDYK